VSQHSSTDRYARLNNTLSVLLVQEKFTLAQLKAKLPEENPAFVTRLVRQLERENHLRAGADGTFSWAVQARDFPAEAWLAGKVYAPQLPQTPAADRPRERLLAKRIVIAAAAGPW
jgi:hypothetical protein